MSDIDGTKLSQLPLGENLADDDLMYAVEDGVSKKVEVGYLKNRFVGGLTLADLGDDSTHRTVTDAEKTAWSGKQDALTFDNAPTSGSSNPVKSSGIYTALGTKANTSDLATVATSGSYTDLSNTPTIPGELADLSDDSTHRLVTDAEKTSWNEKQNALTFDDVPMDGSNNPVKSNGIYDALETKANTSDVPTALAELSDDSTHRVVTDTEKSTWNGKQNALTFDDAPTANSNNPVKSGGIYTAIENKAETLNKAIALKKPEFKSQNVTAAFNISGIVQTNGTLNPSYGKSTDYLEISQFNKLYWDVCSGNTITGYYNLSFYDKNKNVMPSISVATGSTAAKSGVVDLSQPEYADAKYVRASINSTTQYIIDACVLCLSNENNIKNNHISSELKDSIYTDEMNDNDIYYLTIQGNLDDNEYLRSTTDTKKRTSEFIPLENAEKIIVTTVISGYAVFFYDYAKRRLPSLNVASSNSGYFEVVLNQTYADAKYCRFNGYNGVSTFENDQYRLQVVKKNPHGCRKLNNRNVLIFGDSITESANITVNANNETTAYNAVKVNNTGRKMWANILKDEFAFKEMRNYALSGATWKKANDTVRKSAWSQVTIALNDLTNPNNVFPYDTFTPDIIIFALGINDGTPNDSYSVAMEKTVYYSGNETIDLDATLANLDVTKTFQAMRWALLTIKKTFPSAMIFVSLPLQCAKDSNLYESNLVTDIRRMAERCGCIIIDSTNESGIIPEGNFYGMTGTGTTLGDGLHPNKLGQQMFARTIMKSLMQNYLPLIQ